MECPATWGALSKCRWLIRRLQGFASIRCCTTQDGLAEPHALLVLVVKLSGAFTEATDLTIHLTEGAGPELQACRMPSPSCRCISACMWVLPICLEGYP